jgi:hypothetical protein
MKNLKNTDLFILIILRVLDDLILNPKINDIIFLIEIIRLLKRIYKLLGFKYETKPIFK